MPPRTELPGPLESVIRSGPGRLHVRDIGHGVPIIVLHGGPDFDHEYFLPELDRLAESVRLISYDQRGRGRSFSGEGPDDVTLLGEIEDLDRIESRPASMRWRCSATLGAVYWRWSTPSVIRNG